MRRTELGLLAATAALSFLLGDSTQSIIIGVIWVASIGLCFVNEYRAERASAALHSLLHHTHSFVRHTAVVRRDGRFGRVDITDVWLIDGNRLECNKSILSGESTASEKSAQPVNGDAALSDSRDLTFMGTIASASPDSANHYCARIGKLPS